MIFQLSDAQLLLVDAGCDCSKITAASMVSKLHLIVNGSSRTDRKGKKRRGRGKGKKEVTWLRKINDEVDDECGDAEDF